MSTQELIQQVLALPLDERVEVAQALWESIEEAPASGTAAEEQSAIETACRRDAELATGSVVGRSHQGVMEAARRALRCD